MKHSLRSTFTRWLHLHNEEHRLYGHKSSYDVPNWFGYEIRKRCNYKVAKKKSDGTDDIICLSDTDARRSTSLYEIEVSDETLLSIARPN